jgi:XTP/dITP diphosphohydrolase
MSGPGRIILASGNAHKAAEFAALAAASGLARVVVSAAAVGGMPAVVEDAGTFEGNARKKAWALRPLVGPKDWILADDSGLEVDALDRAPGVESAYFAGPAGDAAANLGKLVAVMREVPADRRGARFRCVLVCLDETGIERVFTGTCEGRLLDGPRGGAGFGYDPLFAPAGHDRSFAELGEEVKHALSHRGRAWRALEAALAAQGSGGAQT